MIEIICCDECRQYSRFEVTPGGDQKLPPTRTCLNCGYPMLMIKAREMYRSTLNPYKEAKKAKG